DHRRHPFRMRGRTPPRRRRGSLRGNHHPRFIAGGAAAPFRNPNPQSAIETLRGVFAIAKTPLNLLHLFSARRLFRAALAALDQLADPLPALPADLAEELRAALLAHHLAALAADLGVELRAVALLGGL